MEFGRRAAAAAASSTQGDAPTSGARQRFLPGEAGLFFEIASGCESDADADALAGFSDSELDDIADVLRGVLRQEHPHGEPPDGGNAQSSSAQGPPEDSAMPPPDALIQRRSRRQQRRMMAPAMP